MTVFDFGLCQAIRDCIAGNALPGFQLVQDILNEDGKYRNASELITMYENHDMPRLQSLGASDQMLEIATCLIMTMRGIPCLYYGYEQYLHNDTDGGGDPYNRPMMGKVGTRPLTRFISPGGSRPSAAKIPPFSGEATGPRSWKRTSTFSCANTGSRAAS